MKKIVSLLMLAQLFLNAYSSELHFQISDHSNEDIEQVNRQHKKLFYEDFSYNQYNVSSDSLYKNSYADVLLTLKTDSKVIGFCLFSQIRLNTMYIRWLGVEKEQQGKKLGSYILQHLEARFKPTKIELMAEQAVKDFYIKNGFKVDEGEDEDCSIIGMNKMCEVK